MRLSLRQRILSVAVSALALAALAISKPGIVTLRDGSRYEGEITEEGPFVTIKSRQSTTAQFTRERVAKIEYLEDVELEFNKRHRDLALTDVDARVELAKFCFDHARPDLAKQVLAEALQIDPNNRVAASLYESAKAEVDLDRRRAEREAADPPEKGRTEKPAPTRERPADPESPMSRPAPAGSNHAVLDADQVNRIKQAELRDGDIGVTLKFDNDVERRFAFATGRTLGALRQLSPIDRFMLMRRETNWETLRDVRVQRDPAALLEFRRMQPRILAGCASAACHGGENTNFSLVTPIEGEAGTYTNFYFIATRSAPVILSSGSRANLRLIDRTIPESSLLLQFCIDPKIARFPHPPVNGYRPLFRSPEDPAFALMLRWVMYGLTPIPQDYGFSFEERPGGAQVMPIPASEPLNPSTRPSLRGAALPATRQGLPSESPNPFVPVEPNAPAEPHPVPTEPPPTSPTPGPTSPTTPAAPLAPAPVPAVPAVPPGNLPAHPPK